MKEQCANIRSNLIVSNWSSHHQDCLCVFSHFIINHDHFPRHRVLIKNRSYFAVMFAGFSTFMVPNDNDDVIIISDDDDGGRLTLFILTLQVLVDICFYAYACTYNGENRPPGR